MKKYILIAISLLSLLAIIGCSSSKDSVKTNYQMNEEAIYDNYKVTMKSITKKPIANSNKITLIINVKIDNHTNNNVMIDNDNFGFKDITNYQLIDDLNVLIDKNASKEFKIEYEIEDLEEYELLFYTKVVSNNILFILK